MACIRTIFRTGKGMMFHWTCYVVFTALFAQPYTAYKDRIKYAYQSTISWFRKHHIAWLRYVAYQSLRRLSRTTAIPYLLITIHLHWNKLKIVLSLPHCQAGYNTGLRKQWPDLIKFLQLLDLVHLFICQQSHSLSYSTLKLKKNPLNQENDI